MVFKYFIHTNRLRKGLTILFSTILACNIRVFFRSKFLNYYCNYFVGADTHTHTHTHTHIYIYVITILYINLYLKICLMLLTFSKKKNMSVGREWMYTRLNADGTIKKDFVDGVESFIAYARK